MTANVPTKTSRAAKDVIIPIPIFQSYPIGVKIGYSIFPAVPIYEFSNL